MSELIHPIDKAQARIEGRCLKCGDEKERVINGIRKCDRFYNKHFNSYLVCVKCYRGKV